jgi:hypothetical protein
MDLRQAFVILSAVINRGQLMNTFGQFGFMGCAICGKPLRLATAKSGNSGLPIHDECHMLRLKLKQATTPPPNSAIAIIPVLPAK